MKKIYAVAALNLLLVIVALREIKKNKSNIEEIKDSYNRTGKKLNF